MWSCSRNDCWKRLITCISDGMLYDTLLGKRGYLGFRVVFVQNYLNHSYGLCEWLLMMRTLQVVMLALFYDCCNVQSLRDRDHAMILWVIQLVWAVYRLSSETLELKSIDFQSLTLSHMMIFRFWNPWKSVRFVMSIWPRDTGQWCGSFPGDRGSRNSIYGH